MLEVVLNFLSSQSTVIKIIDFQSAARENRNLIGAVSKSVHQDGPRSCPKAVFSTLLGAKSLFLKDFTCKSFRFKDRSKKFPLTL